MKKETTVCIKCVKEKVKPHLIYDIKKKALLEKMMCDECYNKIKVLRNI